MALVSFELPNAELAPAYREGLSSLSEFRVIDIAEGWVAVEPAEGGDTTRDYFRSTRICDASTSLTEETWQPLIGCSPWEDRDAGRRKRLMDEAVRLSNLNTPQGTLKALEAGIAGANTEAHLFLQEQLPALFKEFPYGSLWLVCVDQVLLSRLIFLHSRVALELTPDRPITPAEMGIHALDGHSITSGVMFEKPLDPILLTFTPGAIGYSFPWSPHALVFLFGQSVELREEQPRSLVSLFEPDVLGDVHADEWADDEFWYDVPPEHVEELFTWWVQRLNVLYSHVADPTRFDEQGRHSPEKQLAWLLTMERLMADGTLILSGPQAPPMSRLEAAFDLLDKTESLLGYGKDGTGKGFQRLLRRSESETRINRSWDSFSDPLKHRFRAHTKTLYDRVYDHVFNHALPFRQTTGVRVNVFNEGAGALVAQGMNDYAPALLRAARNSAHGFLDQLSGPDRHLVATHTGNFPPELADLAALVMLAVFGDPERLTHGTWFS